MNAPFAGFAPTLPSVLQKPALVIPLSVTAFTFESAAPFPVKVPDRVTPVRLFVITPVGNCDCGSVPVRFAARNAYGVEVIGWRGVNAV